MKNFLKSFLLFIIFLLFFYSITIFVWGKFAPEKFKSNLKYPIGEVGHMYSRIKEIKNYKDIDILFIGSSLAYRGFDTRIYKNDGKVTFNLGSSAQTPLQSKILLKRYLNTLRPKLIILEVNPANFSGDGVEPALDIIANDKNDINTTEMAFKINHIKVYNALIYGYISDLFNTNSNYIENSKKGKDKYIRGGFVEREISYFKTDSSFKTKKRWHFFENQLKAFEDIILLLNMQKFNFLIVYPPITSSCYKEYKDSNFDSLMNNYGNYYNFNEKLILNDSLHHYDNNHLNQKGVEIFNRQLIEILKNKKLY